MAMQTPARPLSPTKSAVAATDDLHRGAAELNRKLDEYALQGLLAVDVLRERLGVDGLQLRVEPGALEDLHARRVAARAAVERERDARVGGGGVQAEGVARARDDEARQEVGGRRAVDRG